MRATCSMRYLQRPSICCRPPPTHSLPSLLINRRFNSNLSSSPPPSSSSAPPPPPAQQPQSSQPPRPPPDAAPYFGRSPTSRFRRSQLWSNFHRAVGEGDAIKTQQLFEQLRASGQSLGADTYRKLLMVLKKEEMHAKVMQYFDDLLARGVSPSIKHVNMYLHSAALLDQVDKAEDLLLRLPAMALKPTAVTFNTLIDACIKRGHTEKARSFLARMRLYDAAASARFTQILASTVNSTTTTTTPAEKKPPQPPQGITRDPTMTPSMWTFTLAISTAVKRGNFTEADSLLNQMRAADLKPDAHIYNTIIDGALRHQNNALAERYLSLMRSGLWKADTATYNILIKHAGPGAAAESLLKQMRGLGLQPDEYTFTSLIDLSGKQGNVQAMEHYFALMKQHNVRPSVITYTTLIRHSLRRNREEQARTFMKELNTSGVEPNVYTYTVFIDHAARGGRAREAQSYFDEMKSRKILPNTVAFGSLINAYAKAGDMNGAEQALQQMRTQGLLPNESVYGALIDGYSATGKIDRAEELLKEMKRVGVPIDNNLVKTVEARKRRFILFGDEILKTVGRTF